MSFLKRRTATGSSEAAAASVTGSSEAAGAAAGSSEAAPGGPSNKYTCNQCGNAYYKSEVWIDLEDPSMDWQGSLNLWCRLCWNADLAPKNMWNEKDWRKACKQQWLLREINSNEHYVKRVRSVNWETAKQDIEARHPGENKKEFRARLCAKSLRLALAIGKGITKLKPEQQTKVVNIMDKWVVEWETKAKNPDYVPCLDCTDTTSTHLMEFVDHVLPGLDEFFLCRQKVCSPVCAADCWLNNHPNGQHRCPCCVEQYRPWRPQPGYWTANKVYITWDDDLPRGAIDLVSGSSEATPRHDGTCLIFPVIWPDTATKTIDRIKAVFLELDEELFALAPKDRLGFVIETIASAPPSQMLKHKNFTAAMKDKADDLNLKQRPP